MNKTALIAGSIFGMLGVAIGAFGAHALKQLLIANGRLEVFETGVRYQFYHAIVLLVIGVLGDKTNEVWANRATRAMGLGVIIFSGSLYVLSITNVGYLGVITPFGGLLLIVGWVCLLMGIVRQDNF